MPDYDTGVPHSARIYNYWLGGTDNFAADREVGDRTIEADPNVVLSVRANRAFLARAVRFLARDQGIRQFLDVGTGIPAADNTHEVAQPVAVMFIASLQYAGDDAEVARIVHDLMAPCGPGSFLVISHPASDIDPEQVAELARRFNGSGGDTMTRRDRAGVTRLFDGFDLIEPGVVRATRWHPDSEAEAQSPTALWAGVARKA